jgi:hypothetical protein
MSYAEMIHKLAGAKVGFYFPAPPRGTFLEHPSRIGVEELIQLLDNPMKFLPTYFGGTPSLFAAWLNHDWVCRAQLKSGKRCRNRVLYAARYRIKPEQIPLWRCQLWDFVPGEPEFTRCRRHIPGVFDLKSVLKDRRDASRTAMYAEYYPDLALGECDKFAWPPT